MILDFKKLNFWKKNKSYFLHFFKTKLLKPHKVLTLQRDGVNHQKNDFIDCLKQSLNERTRYKLPIVFIPLGTPDIQPLLIYNNSKLSKIYKPINL